MIKNIKMKTALTGLITVISIACISLLYVTTQVGMTSIMKDSAQNSMESELNAQTILIEEYVNHQEDLLEEFSRSPVIIDYLKDLDNTDKQKAAQAYTETYFEGLDNWEGLYTGEWNTHIVTHSNPQVVGMITREGDSLKQLQDALTNADGIYNAGIILSPASKKLTLSMYCPVYDTDKTILGYVGGGPFAEGLDAILKQMKGENRDFIRYTMVHVDTSMYIFDEDESLITTQVEDIGIQQVIDKIQKDKSKNMDTMTYIAEDGNSYVIAYRYNAAHDWAVISQARERLLYADVYRMMRSLIVICVIACFLIALFSWIFIHISTKPLDYVKKALLDLKALRIHKEKKLQKYVGGRSEVGEIATALNSLGDSLQDIIAKLGACSDSLTSSAQKMSGCSDVLVQCVGENASATEHFAEHTEEINQTVEQVDTGIGEIAKVVETVESQIQLGTARSDELMQKVSQMRQLATESLERTNCKMDENRAAIEKAIVDLQSLTQIDEMANQILDITNQTNMLSLNASIEAARAGEAGRGFNIVAGEIGNLANCSHDTATAIQQICEETRNNISNVQACFDSILNFMENDIKTQFLGFVSATNEYNESIGQIQEIIREMSECSNIFAQSVGDMQRQISSVQNGSGDSQIHTDTVLEKVGQTRKTTEELADIVRVNEENALSIREIMARFSN